MNLQAPYFLIQFPQKLFFFEFENCREFELLPISAIIRTGMVDFFFEQARKLLAFLKPSLSTVGNKDQQLHEIRQTVKAR